MYFFWIGTPLFEYFHDRYPPIFVARGILHGCIGFCCGKDYPSVFANLANEEIRSFIFDDVIGIKTVPIDTSGYSKIIEMDTWKIFLIWYFIATLALSIAYLFYKWIKRLRYTPLFIIRKYLNHIQCQVNIPIIMYSNYCLQKKTNY